MLIQVNRDLRVLANSAVDVLDQLDRLTDDEIFLDGKLVSDKFYKHMYDCQCHRGRNRKAKRHDVMCDFHFLLDLLVSQLHLVLHVGCQLFDSVD